MRSKTLAMRRSAAGWPFHSHESTIRRSATSTSSSNWGLPNGGLPRQRRKAGRSGRSSETTTLPGTRAVLPRSQRCTTSAQMLWPTSAKQ